MRQPQHPAARAGHLGRQLQAQASNEGKAQTPEAKLLL
jgi:hypothetical protein